jgi:tRNA(Ile)-lysidine synthase
MEPIDEAAFAAAMGAFEPFEPEPLIAVGVSGGPDSMALALLLDCWARSLGGRVLGLTVDHGLRPGSAEEALQVGHWLAARGIEHQVLVWTGEKPRAGIQEAARAARYGLLAEACAGRGILHLAVAHHADDQAETILFRRNRGSLDDGLAGMSPERSLGTMRLIRPLLARPKSALVATCAAFGQDFIADPSNTSERFARTPLRRRLDADQGERRALLALGSQAAGRRVARADALAGFLAAVAEIRPDGIIVIDREELGRGNSTLRSAALAAMLRTAGGLEHGPNATSIARLDTALQSPAFRGVALGGCMVRRWGDALLVCREPGRVAPPVGLIAGVWRQWDRRFAIRVGKCAAGEFTVGPLGVRGFAWLRKLYPIELPSAAGASLPAIRTGESLLSVPCLGWQNEGAPAVEQRFLPLWPLSSERFTVVSGGPGIMFDRGDDGPLLPADFGPAGLGP